MAVRTSMIAGKTDSAEDFRLSLLGLWTQKTVLNARTGVTVKPTLTGTGSFTCTVSPFSCIIDGTSNSLQGAYMATLDAAETVTIAAADTSARIDLISLQIEDDAYDGSGLSQGQILYTKGTPGSGVAPNAPANSISLFTVPVAANASSVNFASATGVYSYTAAAGGIIPVSSAASAVAVTGAVQYRHRLDVTAAAGSVSPLESSVDGTTWHPVFDPGYGTWTDAAVADPTFVEDTPVQYRTAPGSMVQLRGTIHAGVTSSAGTVMVGSLPRPAYDRTLPLITTSFLGEITIAASDGNLRFYGSSAGTAEKFSFDGLSYSL